MAGCLAENGRIFLANWQFMDSPRQRRKRQPWSHWPQPADVEAGDHLLNWQRGGYGLRYVCQIDAGETAVMAQATNLQMLTSFAATAGKGDLSLYTVSWRMVDSFWPAKRPSGHFWPLLKILQRSA
jgi:hypothetical protein